MALVPGSTIGRFKIQSLIGKGGMGEVFSAVDTRLDRKVAVKILPPEFATDADRLRRFESEAKTLASLSHPNILVIHEVGSDNGHPYLVSELLEGRTLREELADGALPHRKATDYALQIAQGLAAAHARGIIHRDLKPENIFLTKESRVKILDFGLAKLRAFGGANDAGATCSASGEASGESRASLLRENAPTLIQSTVPGLVLGTPAYMSPEQVRGEPTDHRSDIFAFGCVLFQMLTGNSPFARGSAAETMSAVLRDEPPDFSRMPDASVFPQELLSVVQRCLEKDPHKRFQSAADLAFALTQLGSGHPLQPAPRAGGRLVPVALIALLVVIAGLTVLKMRSNRNSPGGAATPGSNAATPVQKSVAVLPFVNMSPDKGDEYLSDGLTEELLNALAKVKGLRVPGRSSSFAFKGKHEEGIFRRVGEQLNVGTVLEGSVRKAGDRLRVTAQLIDVADGFHLWSETYDRDMTNIFAIQSEIAGRVADALRVQLLGGDAAPTKPTENVEAYKLYLQGRQQWNRRTGKSILQAIDYFNQAIALDENFALAWAGLADCYVILDEYAGTPPRESKPKARAAALKAIELDRTLVEPRATLAHHQGFYEWDWKNAESQFREAIALNPNHATSFHWYGLTLLMLGRFEEAIAQLVRAKEVDPLSPVLSGALASALSFGGQEARAIQLLEKQLSLTPEFPGAYATLGDIYLRQENYSEAIAALEKAQELAPEYLFALGRLGGAYARMNRTDAAKQMLQKLLDIQNTGRDASMSIAFIYHSMGSDVEALTWFERAVENRQLAEDLFIYPSLKELRSHPRAQTLLREMNLIP